MIKTFIHGKDAKEIFPHIGKWIVDKNVHDEIGMAVTAEDGDLWFLYKDCGFAQLRPMKNGSGHMRYLFGDCKKSLVEKVIEEAKRIGLTSIYINEKKDALDWQKYGFEKKTNKKNSAYFRFEKQL